ncbi:MAG TPA: hypothetical protein VFO91_17490 [Anaerolineales bacterium]|nr:hypothetical protein [Anaerolineales bacterium]
MRHPLEFLPNEFRKPAFLTLLALTLILVAVFRILDQPLQTSAAPHGIVSFELAGNAQTARAITNSWKQMSLLLSAVAGQANPDIVNVPYAFAAFGLGLDYLFMPVYALTLGLGTLFAGERYEGWLRSLGAVAGYGALAAALFDAVENYALWQILLGAVESAYPATAAFCAIIKFALLLAGISYVLVAWMVPKGRDKLALPRDHTA